MIKRIFILCFLLTPLFIFSQSLEEKYLTQANQNYLDANYSKAYDLINFVLDISDGEELSPTARLLGEKIYYYYATEVLNSGDYENLPSLKNNLAEHPEIQSSRVNGVYNDIVARQLEEENARKAEAELKRIEAEEAERLAQIEAALEAERLEQEALEAIRQQEREEYEERERIYQEQLQQAQEDEQLRNEEQQALLREEIAQNQALEQERINQMQLERAAYEQRMIELIETRDNLAAEQQERINEILVSSIEATASASGGQKMSLYIILLIAIVGIFIFAGFGIMIFLFIRKSSDDQRRFENTLYAMQNVQLANEMQAQYALPDMAQSMAQLQLTESNAKGELPPPDDESARIRKMIELCKDHGEQIDAVTKRKNNSKNIAEMVFKISKELGYNEKESILHFAVGLVYDIGFLSIDSEILGRSKVTEEEFEIIQNHVNLGLNMIYFIEKDYQPLFREGILKHHENLDGSGYPSGLKENEIPYIARVIHAVESFISLVSVRDYKEIMDKETAINTLHRDEGRYDEKILEALNAII